MAGPAVSGGTGQSKEIYKTRSRRCGSRQLHDSFSHYVRNQVHSLTMQDAGYDGAHLGHCSAVVSGWRCSSGL